MLRNCKLIISSIVFMICIFLLIKDRMDINEQLKKLSNIVNVRLRTIDEQLNHFQYLESDRRNYLQQLWAKLQSVRGDLNIAVSDGLNKTKSSNASGFIMDDFLPSIYSHMSHLQKDKSGLVPAFIRSKFRRGVYLTIGIPTVIREKHSYLFDTLQSLVDNLPENEARNVLIVILVAEPGMTQAAHEIIHLIENKMDKFLQSGLVEVVVPSASYYPPDLNSTEPTMGDSLERMIWRTKQNLDYIYLMSYCRSRGQYYMQLEDDVITKPNYLSFIRTFVDNNAGSSWLMLEFSSLGFIGKLFRSRTLPLIIHFLVLFHRDKPVDWLLWHLFYVRYCHLEKDSKHCNKEMAKRIGRLKPSLFQHIGVHSSLKGKHQMLKEKDFGDNLLMFRSHANPTARVSTSLKVFKKHTLWNAYNGQSAFWAMSPAKGDYILFEFQPSIMMTGFVFASGSPTHDEDLFYNATVEALLTDPGQRTRFPTSSDIQFCVLTRFDLNGRAEMQFDDPLKVSYLRIVFETASNKWLLVKEMWIKAEKVKTSVPTTTVK
ncbi:Alpha-1,3-mannosyl-glycoprotein 4-beta-N-acetylglucosaminyltransferase A [Trichinella britovi]|uniref:Alpha-1,3-mannosyl-glycoprotein 4-beta-N-acetylglucosaminyltransferase A n=1 Tax=Trichinella britovi TaxID=45882 RepID=A0A0V1CF20_TRIBR|nr:Alpha-1,3-mannosyl-glycoprotein 4-beta-N-acetylglucosaminyltransferase A [Trichinella britovi]KRZ96972.1 Alpha-1,3-mannosyl-glycoprotein 4-beta-N-acetylglucosaminyltransferase A [Trichinella sp. T8]